MCRWKIWSSTMFFIQGFWINPFLKSLIQTISSMRIQLIKASKSLLTLLLTFLVSIATFAQNKGLTSMWKLEPKALHGIKKLGSGQLEQQYSSWSWWPYWKTIRKNKAIYSGWNFTQPERKTWAKFYMAFLFKNLPEKPSLWQAHQLQVSII